MFRFSHTRHGGITPNSSGIITHAQDNSSRVEIGNKVFINANINPNETGTSTSFLAQKNNDSMSFAWNRMQVINLSRQQKAVCTREQNKLTTLERHFTRQSHLENFKQSCLIDKFKRRLERLNKLRTHVAEKSNIDNFGRFPLEHLPSASPREIASQANTSINRNGSYKAAVKSGRFPLTITGSQTDKNTVLCDIPYSGNHRTYASYKTRRETGTQPVGDINSYIYSGPVITEHEINTRQIVEHSPYQRYRSKDKHRVRSSEDCEVKYNEGRIELNENKSDLLNVRKNTTVNRNSALSLGSNTAVATVKNNKSVRFQSDHVIEQGKDKLDSGDFRKLVQLSHSFRQSKRK